MIDPTHNGDEPSLNRIHDVLADPTRRALLEILQETSPITVDAVVTHLSETQSKPSKQLKAALHHVHLPKMADAQVIDYDPTAERIRTNGTTETAYNVMDRVAGEEAE